METWKKVKVVPSEIDPADPFADDEDGGDLDPFAEKPAGESGVKPPDPDAR